MKRLSRVLVVAAALALGCSEPSGPVAGDLIVSLTGALQARAVKFRLVGPRTAVGPGGTGYRVYTANLLADTMHVIVVAPQGTTLATGPVGRVAVPDVRQVGAYVAIVDEVAGPTYALQNPTQFTLTVVRP
jgi:hypothetical protein